MENNSPEGYSKYQKLALEYSKLKAQFTVLKTALTDQQSTSSELQESLKKKDLLVRKLEQEVDCLNFRNLQLTKRVSILQTDLEVIDASHKGSKGKSSPKVLSEPADSYNILNVELQSRIKENENLHQQVYALDLDHQREVCELASTVESLKSKLKEQEHKLNEKSEEHQKTVNTLLKEKTRMQASLKEYEKEVKEIRTKKDTYEKELSVVKSDLTSQLEDANNRVSEKITFNDTQLDHLNSLNVPTLMCRKQAKLTAVFLKLCGLITRLAQQLSDLHLHMEQKIRITLPNENLNKISGKFAVFQQESSQLLKDIQLSVGHLISTIHEDSLTTYLGNSNVQQISKLFSRYVCHLDKLHPYLILSIQYEDALEETSSKIKEINKKLMSITHSVMSCFKKLETYVQLIFNDSSKEKQYLVTQSIALKKILSTLMSLQLLFDETRKHFGCKISAQYLIGSGTGEAMKIVDESLLSSLVSLSSTANKMIQTIEGNLDSFSGEELFISRSPSKQAHVSFKPCVWNFKERGTKYVNQIHENETPSVPLEVALENSRVLRNHSENQENLSQQIEEYRNKISHLELEKENWMLECQFLKAKQSKNRNSPTEAGDEGKTPDYEALHLFAKDTVNQLIKQIQLADSKVVAFKNESESLLQKVKMSLQKELALQQDIINFNKVISHMKEEQTTLVKSYEDQLSQMSDHLANMNELLTSQNEEIDVLKQAANHKVTKKGKK